MKENLERQEVGGGTKPVLAAAIFKKNQQATLFNIESEIEKEWKGMPEFSHEDRRAYHSILVNFECKEDFDKFREIISKSITKNTKSIYYPNSKLNKSSKYLYTDEPSISNICNK
jgi:hypothetical protein